MEADQKRFSAKTKDEEYDDEFDQGKVVEKTITNTQY